MKRLEKVLDWIKSATWLKKLVYGTGIAITFVAVFYLCQRVFQRWDTLAEILRTPGSLTTMAVVIVLNAVSMLTLALAWRELAGARSTISRRLAIRIYGRSNILKYLPSNVLHLAGRQVLGRRHGIGHAALARASFLEMSLVLAAGALLVSPILIDRYEIATDAFIYGGAGIAGVGALLLVFGRRLPALYVPARRLRPLGKGLSKRALASALATYLGFLLLNGLLVAVICQSLGGPEMLSAEGMLIVGYAIAAWLIGLVTPGAPAGLGVREATFLVIAGGVTGEPVALSAMLIYRLANILADLLLFVVALAIGPAKPTAGD